MLFTQRLISTVEPGIEPGDRKVECILDINTTFDENCVDTYYSACKGSFLDLAISGMMP